LTFKTQQNEPDNERHIEQSLIDEHAGVSVVGDIAVGVVSPVAGGTVAVVETR
jgi:hypothetical protein